jgi:hypothetical protein
MTREDYPEFVKCLGLCYELVGGQKPTPEAVKFFFGLVQEFELQDVKAALQHHAKNSPYAPKPSDIAECLRGTVDDRAMLAWNAVKTAMLRRCSSDSVRFDDPVIHWAIDRMGGWTALFNTLEYERVALERSFVSLYKQGSRFATWANVPPYLPGTCEISMRANGFDSIRPPIDAVTGKRRLDALPGGTP